MTKDPFIAHMEPSIIGRNRERARELGSKRTLKEPLKPLTRVERAEVQNQLLLNGEDGLKELLQ